MIKSEHGRARSVLDFEEMAADLRKQIAALSEDEYAALVQMLEEAEGGDTTLLRAVMNVEYEHVPVDVRTFMTEPYFLGDVGKSIWPKLLEDMVELFEGRYSEVIMGGSLGYGKSFFASCCICYVLYLMSCLHDPQRAYGIDPGSTLGIALVSKTQIIARQTIFQEVKGKLQRSPYFTERFVMAVHTNDIEFPKNIKLVAGSPDTNASIGLNLFSAIVDEANFYGESSARFEDEDPTATIDRVSTLYDSIKNRMKSRFMKVGKLPGLLLVMSSKTTPDSFTERRIAEAMEEGDQTVFVREYATWDVVGKGRFSGKTFPVVVGNDRIRSKILTTEAERALYEKEKMRILDVPVEYRPEFVRNLEKSIREIGGCSTQAIEPFIARTETILGAVDEEIPELVEKQEWTCGEPLPFRWDRVCKRVTRKLSGGYSEEAFELLRDPDAPRVAHIDGSQGKKDAAGIAVGHIVRMVEVVRTNLETLEQYIEIAPLIEFDLILRVLAPKGDEIILGELRAILYRFVEKGFHLAQVTTDSWQSVDTHQKFKEKGIPSRILSVDTSVEPYERLKTALYEDRLRMQNHAKALEELQKLKRMMQGSIVKIDHPRRGCFVGSTRIPLLDGTFPQIEELAGKTVDVYSTKADGTIVPGRARGRYTKHVTELVDVVLDSGAVERCTPDHPWMLRDGSYKEARLLRPGIDRLMPVTRQWPVNGGYERVVDSQYRETLTHRMVWEALHGPLPEGYCVHHVNHVKTDNRPENLSGELLSDHARKHTALRHATDQNWRDRLYAGAKTFNESEEGRQKHSEALRQTNLSMSEEDKKKRARSRGSFRLDIDRASLEAVRSDPAATNANAVARVLGCGRNVVMRVLKDSGVLSWEEFAALEPGQNHKVRAVIPVRMVEPVPVYDLEVDEWSNFALASGVVVHNSKDCTDAMAGVVYTLSSGVVSRPMEMSKGASRGLQDDDPQAHDHRWVTGGKIPVVGGQPVVIGPKGDFMPFLKG